MPNKKIVVFTSPTCAPCKRLKPELIGQSELREFALEVVELSEETRPRFTEVGIRAVPVTIAYDGDIEIGRFSGQLSSSSVEAKLVEWGF
jgi:thioredoxin-like negative regulator of GroEL